MPNRQYVERLEDRLVLSGSSLAAPQVVRIDAGGPAYTDSSGHLWSADNSFVGGGANTNTFPVAGTSDPRLFSTRRVGTFQYDLAVANGSYTLDLLFAEPYSKPGQRVFDVTANGRPLLTNFDIAATVGLDKALTEQFSITVSTASVKLNFAGVKGNALLSALELIPKPTPTPTPTSSPLTILPLGDSITWGFDPEAAPSGGYRSRLYEDFSSHKQAIQFEGSVYDKYSKELEAAGEAWDEGHGAYTINDIDDNLTADGPQTSVSSNDGGHWLDGTGSRPAIYPNIILLMAGTNDMIDHLSAGAAAAMDRLLHNLTTDRPKAVIFVSSIIPLVDPTENAEVKAFNQELQTVLVPKYQKLGAHVVFVNQYANFIDSRGNVVAGDLADGVHPDRAGYNRMGDTWYAAVEKYEHPGAA